MGGSSSVSGPSGRLERATRPSKAASRHFRHVSKMADQFIDLPNGYTLIIADLSEFPMPPDHPPVTFIPSTGDPIVLPLP